MKVDQRQIGRDEDIDNLVNFFDLKKISLGELSSVSKIFGSVLKGTE